MKSFILSILLCVFVASVPFGNYKGDLVVRPSSPYTMKDVKVRVVPNSARDKATIYLYQIKFSRLMPVKLDITLPNVSMTQSGNKYLIKGENIVPLKGGKPYPSRMVSFVKATLDEGNLDLNMCIGSAPIRFVGKN